MHNLLALHKLKWIIREVSMKGTRKYLTAFGW